MVGKYKKLSINENKKKVKPQISLNTNEKPSKSAIYLPILIIKCKFLKSKSSARSHLSYVIYTIIFIFPLQNK